MKSTFVVLALVLVAGSSMAELKLDWNGGIYPTFRYDAFGTTFKMMSAEADLSARYSTPTRDIATGVLQLWAAPFMRDQSAAFHFGEAYLMIPLGLGWPTIKAGEAPIPFGLLADYDTHTQIIQPPYARTLGVRIDQGAGFQGKLGCTDYAFWVSNGIGPYVMDMDKSKVVTGRVAPKFMLGDAEMTVGLSALGGALPYTHLINVLTTDAGPFIYHMRQAMDMTGRLALDSTFQAYMESTYRAYVDTMQLKYYINMDTFLSCEPSLGCWMYRARNMKYRLGLDNTTDWGPATFHLEGVVGKDFTLSGPLVYSYYLEGRYAVTDWVEPIVRYDAVHVDGQGTHSVVDGGITLYHPDLSAVNLQVVYQYEWLDMVGLKRNLWNLSAEIAYRF